MTTQTFPTRKIAPDAADPGLADVRVTLAGHGFDYLYVRHAWRWVGAILVAYLIVAFLYVILTPPWQAPDEPAHYNYIAHIVHTGSLPVLQLGDYDQTRLGLLLSFRFPDDLSIAPLRYESYQPPLYYLSAAPIYLLTNGNLLTLRLYNVFLGAVTLLLLYRCLALVFPTKPLISVTAMAFAAMLPMHVAVTAALNNDVLAELLLMAALLALLHWAHDQFYADLHPVSVRRQRRQLLLMGALIGLGMLTKIYAYAMLPITIMVVGLIIWLQPRVDTARAIRPDRVHFWLAVRRVFWVIIPALLLPLPMWIRNIHNYGAWDFMGLQWHDQVVVGQPRTADWIAQFGWVAYGERAFSFTFKSFWGVFGWMGVFMDERVYTALLIFSGVIFLGLLWATVRLISGPPDTDMDRYQVGVQVLFGLILLAVFASYLWYNVKFVQHQGRYFFWGLLPISAMAALGWREVLQPIQGLITGFLVGVLAVSLALAGYLTGDMAKWPVILLALTAAMLLVQPVLLAGADPITMGWLPSPLQRVAGRPWVKRILGWLRVMAWAVPFALLFALNLAIPFAYIIPQLVGE